MHFTSYLAALLTLAPAALSHKNCVQLMVSYGIPCDEHTKHCDAGYSDLSPQEIAAFAKGAEDFRNWVADPSRGGTCGGECFSARATKKSRYTGTTWMMDCYGSRVTKEWNDNTIKAPPAPLAFHFIDDSCHVYCDLKSERSCKFSYNHC